MRRIRRIGFLLIWSQQISLSVAFSSIATPTPTTSSSSVSTLSANPPLRLEEHDNKRVASNPFLRALELSSIVATDLLQPLLWSLLTEGLPETKQGWEDFWQRRIESNTPYVSQPSNAERLCQAIQSMGVTYVKFGQSLSSRSDLLPVSLTRALSQLLDDVEETMDRETACQLLRLELSDQISNLDDLEQLVSSLSQQAVAAASIGQVYQAQLPNYGPVAIKIQRPGIRELVQRDRGLITLVAQWVDHTLPLSANLTPMADEFLSRLEEELDFGQEARNMQTFRALYCHRTGSVDNVKVVVPELLYHTPNVLVMEWIEGTKLTDINTEHINENEALRQQNLDIVRSGMTSTLSQLLDQGVMHADCHEGNLIKVPEENGQVRLGYLDYGMVSVVPEQVRDGLVCAVAQLVFGRNVTAVVDLFAELMLLDPKILQNPTTREELINAMEQILDEVLVYPQANDSSSSSSSSSSSGVPDLRFDKLLGGLTLLVYKFEFQLPPYFLNNAWCLASLEGTLRKLDPHFCTMEAVYPFALKRLFFNPSNSPVVERTLYHLVRNEQGQISTARTRQLIHDAAAWTGQSKRQVVQDILVSSPLGRRMARQYVKEATQRRLFKWTRRRRRQ